MIYVNRGSGKNLWPTFIGSRTTAEEDGRSSLPVLLWPEQRKYVCSIFEIFHFAICNRGEKTATTQIKGGST